MFYFFMIGGNMKTEYLDFMKQILDKSDLNLQYKENFIEENLNTKKILISFNEININSSESEIRINWKPILAIPSIFGIFDIFLESKYQNLINNSFKKKYDYLPNTNDTEKIQKNFYRIYKVIRNAITHNIENIIYHECKNIIDYTTKYNKKETYFHLEISDDSLIMLYKATISMMDDKIYERRGIKFYEGLLTGYNNFIINKIDLKDDIDENNFFYCESIPLSMHRDIVCNSIIEVNDENIIIENSKREHFNARDFAFVFEENCYVVPEEYLIDNKINKSEINDWKVERKICACHI